MRAHSGWGWNCKESCCFTKSNLRSLTKWCVVSLDLSNDNARMHQLLGAIYVIHGQNPAAMLQLQKAAET